MGKILGLDLGTNSIGWAVLDRKEKQFELLNKGVHVFSEGIKIEKGVEYSKAAERTKYRSARRIKFRRKLRKQETLEVLINNKMCPLSIEELNNWKKNKKEYPKSPEFLNWLRTDEATEKNPYFFRNKASREKMPLQDLGRAFYHLAQRRGFLSNRLDQGNDGRVEQLRQELFTLIEAETEKDELSAMLGLVLENFKEEEDKAVIKFVKNFEKTIKGVELKSFEEIVETLKKFLNKTENLGAVKKSINELTQKIQEQNCKTIGQYFYKLYQNKEKIRVQYTDRKEHYLKEFEKICIIQQLDGIKEKEDLPQKRYMGIVKELFDAIFFYRPLKSQKGLVGKCSFEKNKPRCPVSHPAYEEYRALQFINSIKCNGEFLTKEQRENIWPLFTRKSKPNFDFIEIRKNLSPNENDWKFNYTDKTNVSGCPTIAQLSQKNLFSENWKESIYERYTNKETRQGKKNIEEVITDIWHVLYSFDDKNGEIKRWAERKLGLDSIRAKKFSAIVLKKEYSNLSLKAINKILPFLREGLIYSYAVFLANIGKVVGKEIWNDKENQKIIRNSVKEIIDKFNEIKKRESIVNDLVGCFKNEYNNSHKDYTLDNQDRKNLRDKILSVYGKKTFPELSSEKQNEIINWVEDKFTEQLRKYRGEFIKPKRLDEKIVEFLLSHDRFGVTEKSLKNLYHPSDIEKFEAPKRSADEKLYLGSPIIDSIKNPMAMRTMHQLRKLVNTLVKEGTIDFETKVHIELARELNDSNKRYAIKKWQSERKDLREKYKEEIKILFREECKKEIEPSEDEILKFQLWNEQNRICLYSGKSIGICDFIGGTPNYEIEHTIPKSLSFDNSQENLTLCEINFNRNEKRNKIPFELSNHAEILIRLSDWEKNILEFEEKFNSRKKARGTETKEQKDKRIRQKHYFKLHLDYWKGKINRFKRNDIPEGFKNSQLVDTGIITKYARAYLKSAFEKVYSVKGSMTSEFRKLWGLQEIHEKKERKNHIHHCIDAITIACMTKDKYDMLAKIYHNDEEGFHKVNKETMQIIKPWPTFTEDVKAIENEVLVSHHTPDNMKKQTKKKLRIRGKVQMNKEGVPIFQQGDTVRGSLHKETFYGAILVKETDKKTGEVIKNENGKINRVEKYVIRMELGKLKETDVPNIVDPVVKEKVELAIKENGFKKAMAEVIWMNKEKGIRIKKVRVFAPTVTSPIKLKLHRDVSKYEHKQNYHVMNDGNYIMAIYEGKDKKEKMVRDFNIVNVMEAGEQLKLSNRNLSALVKPLKLVGKGKNEIEIPLKAIIKKGTMVLFYKNNPEEIWELSDEEKGKRLYKVQKFDDRPRITCRFHQMAKSEKEITEKYILNLNEPCEQYSLSLNNFNVLFERIDFNISLTGKLDRAKSIL